jgi:hypothetical protein
MSIGARLVAALFRLKPQTQCLLLALSGHAELHCTCPLLGVKRPSSAIRACAGFGFVSGTLRSVGKMPGHHE